MKRILLLIVLTSLTISCTKQTTISGRIYNANTNESIEGELVWVYPKYSEKRHGDSIPLITDSNGEFSTTIKDRKNPAFLKFVGFDETEYVLLDTYERFIKESKELVKADLPVLRKKGFNVHVKNTQPIFTYFKTVVSLEFTNVLIPEYYTNKQESHGHFGVGFNYISGIEGETEVELLYLDYLGNYHHETKTIFVDFNIDDNEVTFEI